MRDRTERPEDARLGMGELLRAVADHKLGAWEHLIQRHHPGSVMAKFEKAARKGFTDYGTTPRMAWLTNSGIAYLITRPDGWFQPDKEAGNE